MLNYRLYIVLLALLSCNAAPAPRPVPVVAGVNVVFDKTEGIFPDSWTTNQVKAKAEAIDTAEIARTTTVVQTALAKYPATFLKKNLNTIYCLKKLYFFGVPFGATYFDKTKALYIANNGRRNGYTNRYIEQSIHHEFSSLLYLANKSKLDEKAWAACNPKDFIYTDDKGGGVTAIKNNADGTYFSDYYNKQGFLDQYSQTTLENDINQIAQQIFCPDPQYKSLLEKYPQLKAKHNLLIAFYTKLDSTFNAAYFAKY